MPWSSTASNNASLTLGLANQGSSPPGVPLTQSNTYNGGTTVNGGMLFAVNGNAYLTAKATACQQRLWTRLLGATDAALTDYSGSPIHAEFGHRHGVGNGQ